MADRVFAFIILIIVAIFWLESYQFSSASGGYTLAPSFFPRVLLITLLSLSLLLFIKSFFTNSTSKSFKGIGTFFKTHWRVPVMIGFFFLFIVMIDAMGFVVSAVLFLLASFALLLEKYTPKMMVISVSLAFLLPVSISWIFQSFLRAIIP